MDNIKKLKSDLVHLVRLSISGSSDDVRLYVAKMIRRLRSEDPELSQNLENLLRSGHTRSTNLSLRKQKVSGDNEPEDQSRLFRVYNDHGLSEPLLDANCKRSLLQLLTERKSIAKLRVKGLEPSKSAIFIGPPGMGKTLSARWLAQELGAPLMVLDLASVMSSYLGESGVNLKRAFEFSKRNNCVLLVDEIDALAKMRGDQSDVGELKRLVTVALQEIDAWDADNLLLAATNHPELIDRAIWRRFDLVADFSQSSEELTQFAVEKFLGPDKTRLSKWIPALSILLRGISYGEIEKQMNWLRRGLALGMAGIDDLISRLIVEKAQDLSHKDRVLLAMELAEYSKLSQRKIAELTSISRETIRKRVKLATG